MHGGVILFSKPIVTLTSFLVLINLPFVLVAVAEVNYRTLRAQSVVREGSVVDCAV